MNRELLDPPGIIRPVDNLVELAGRINAEHHQAEAALRTGLQHAKSAGDLLIEAKKQCKHGEWLPWLKKHVHFSERTAQGYMRVSKRWGELEAKAQRVADLPYREAVGLLAHSSDGWEANLQEAVRLVEDCRRECKKHMDADRQEEFCTWHDSLLTAAQTVCEQFCTPLIETPTDDAGKLAIAIKAMGAITNEITYIHLHLMAKVGKAMKEWEEKLGCSLEGVDPEWFFGMMKEEFAARLAQNEFEATNETEIQTCPHSDPS